MLNTPIPSREEHVAAAVAVMERFVYALQVGEAYESRIR
jgi:hypothetical protein